MPKTTQLDSCGTGLPTIDAHPPPSFPPSLPPLLVPPDWAAWAPEFGLALHASGVLGGKTGVWFLQLCLSCSRPTDQTPCQGPRAGQGRTGTCSHQLSGTAPRAVGQPKGRPQCETSIVPNSGAHHRGGYWRLTIGDGKGLVLGCQIELLFWTLSEVDAGRWHHRPSAFSAILARLPVSTLSLETFPVFSPHAQSSRPSRI